MDLLKAGASVEKKGFLRVGLWVGRLAMPLVAHSVGKWAYLLAALMAPQKVYVMAAPSVF
jgi:hypothetical protein